MECFTFIILGFILFMGIAQVFDWIKGKNLDKQISEALENGNLSEYFRLVNLKNVKDNKLQGAQGNYPTDLDYLEAMIVLDAAENGVFFPEGQQVFERLDNRNPEYYPEYEDEYYEEYYDEYDEGEYSDHWGLG
jgi:hypothetical protein